MAEINGTCDDRFAQMREHLSASIDSGEAHVYTGTYMRQSPAPFIPKQPFEPYALAAVELAEEKLTILGQVVADYRAKDLRVGMELEVVIDTLYEDDEHEYLIWKWSP